ncbi:TPA: phage major tail protein, TP901-1 family [Streptococcus pyogenes]|nr:phage major tail protein, TP901-1 family [Streptococcus pyogenes]HER7533208.1 phage major tail protein, TP901-1 family [Streptococcus pyogenes]HER7720016.1 phage major tail protein, TP901-1 family [Streptococcus pyogenes]HER7774948.1 phage major tail protein, TP901-1 family [Streptococcus pyogenes]HER8649098.1 phage major tail protein, TP901-1 family [Streptococcus pyogenes]
MANTKEGTTIEITTGKPIVGKKIFYFIQSVDAKKGSKALLPAYRTDGTTTMGGEYIDEQTQQGRVIEKATDEHSIDLTTYFVPTDPSVAVIEEAKKTGKSIKIWEVIADESVKEQSQTSESGGSKKDVYPAKFGYAKIDEIERSTGISDLVEMSYTANIVGALQDGKFPLTKEEIEMLENVYGYQNPGDTTGDYDNITK